MKVAGWILAVVASGVLAGAWIPRGLPHPPAGSAPPTTGDCIACHAKRQPGLLAQWNASRHAAKGVVCEDCHGDDHEAIFRAEGRVAAKMCQGCHQKETLEFKRSVHARAFRDATANARLMAQIPAMRRRGCMGCHDIGGPRGGRCNACHGAHRYSAKDARTPESCGGCHRGPDHPHIEAWEASRHGIVYGETHDAGQAPTCATCHMAGGNHDVSAGLTLGKAGSGAVLEGEPAPIPMHRIAREDAKKQRAYMLGICTRCHTARTARRDLEDADRIKREADRLVGEAAAIVKGLYRDKLLDPMPEEREAHPTAGHALVLGGPMLYENQSNAERIFFDLAKFAHAITFKGAYHQSPDHTHWLGIARLKASLEELRAEDRRLRQAAKR